MQIIKCQHYRKCDIYAVSQPILQVSWEGFLRAFTHEIVFFYDQRLIWGSIQGIGNKEIWLSSFTNSFTDPDKQCGRDTEWNSYPQGTNVLITWPSMALPSHVSVSAKMSMSREITRSEIDITLFFTLEGFRCLPAKLMQLKASVHCCRDKPSRSTGDN